MRAWGLCGLSSSCFVSHMCRRVFGIGIRLERLQMMRSRKVEPYTEAMERGVMKTKLLLCFCLHHICSCSGLVGGNFGCGFASLDMLLCGLVC